MSKTNRKKLQFDLKLSSSESQILKDLPKPPGFDHSLNAVINYKEKTIFHYVWI